MGAPWEDFVNGVADTTGKLAKQELKDLVTAVKNDTEEFLKKQGEKLELYLNQLAKGEITKQQFESYILDLRNMTEMQALKMSVAAKARAQRLVEGLTKHILDGLITLL